MPGSPLLARMREAGLMSAPMSRSIDFEVPSVHLEPDDSVSQITSNSPSKAGWTKGSSPKKRSKSGKLTGLAAPDSTVSSTQRNRKALGTEEESAGQGWVKLRKAVKKTKKKSKVPVRDLTDTPHYRMGERDQVIASKEKIKQLESENARLRQDFKPLVREVEKGQIAESKRDRAIEDCNALKRQLTEQQAEHAQAQRRMEDDNSKLRDQVERLETDNREAEVGIQTLRSTLESTQRELSAARDEIEQLRAEMLERREQAARDAAKIAEVERDRRVEVARETLRQDAALESHILKLAKQVGAEPADHDGTSSQLDHREDEGASSYTQPSSPQSSTANIAAHRSEERQDGYECPHCHGRKPGVSQDHDHVPAPRRERQAAHVAVVAAAQHERDSNQQDQPQRNGRASHRFYSPQQSAASAAALAGMGALTGLPMEGRTSSAVERQRRAEWIEHVLQMGRSSDSSPGAGSDGRRRGTGHGTQHTHDDRTPCTSSYEEHARASMNDRARVREDERAAREQARAEECRTHQLRAEEREEEARRCRWAMRHSQSASEVIREVSSISANGIGGSLETRFDSPPSRVGVSPPRHRGISEGTTAGRSTSPVLVAALSGRGVDAAYQFEARARELEAEGAALRAEAEAEVAAAWASVENSGVASEYLLPRGEVGDSLNKSGSMSPGSPRDHKHFTGQQPYFTYGR